MHTDTSTGRSWQKRRIHAEGRAGRQRWRAGTRVGSVEGVASNTSGREGSGKKSSGMRKLGFLSRRGRGRVPGLISVRAHRGRAAKRDGTYHDSRRDVNRKLAAFVLEVLDDRNRFC